MKMEIKLAKPKKMNNPQKKVLLSMFFGCIFLILSCETKVKTTYNFPPLPNLPEKRSPLLHNSVEYANKVAIELAERKFCDCLRNSEKEIRALCENIADNEMRKLAALQQDKTIQFIMQNTYNEVKERCKMQMGLKSLPQ